jgi:uncharacterized protein (TIGR03067 family)
MRRAFFVVLALSAVVAVRAADDNPEPPGKGGAELRKLKGKWTVTRRVFRGTELKGGVTATYEFNGDKVTIDNGRLKYVAKVKADVKNKPAMLELTREDTKTTSRLAFKIDKGELYLVLSPPKGNVQADEDFTGMNRPLMVLSREKKKE